MDYKKKLPKFSKYLNQISKKYLENKIKLYQDLSSQHSGSRNQTEKRWRLIKKKLIKDNIKNLLDLGSAEGYFLKKTSEIGIMSLGVEADVFVSTDNQQTWINNSNVYQLDIPGYETTWEAITNTNGSDDIYWYLSGFVNSAALGLDFGNSVLNFLNID